MMNPFNSEFYHMVDELQTRMVALKRTYPDLFQQPVTFAQAMERMNVYLESMTAKISEAFKEMERGILPALMQFQAIAAKIEFPSDAVRAYNRWIGYIPAPFVDYIPAPVNRLIWKIAQRRYPDT